MENIVGYVLLALAVVALWAFVDSLRQNKRREAINSFIVFAAMIGLLNVVVRIEPGPSTEAVANGHLTPSKEFVWIRANQRLVAEKLKDPDSATFGKADRVSYRTGGPVVCGTVNAKNSFGAYGGAQKYIGMGDKLGVYLANEVKDFNNLWQKVCD
jgi:hypothetical protein